MFTLDGDFGKIIFEGNTGDNGQKSSNYLTLDTKSSLNFFNKISVLKTNIALNALGLFSRGTMGRNGEVRFASLSTPRHLFRPRRSGCTWKSKGRIDMQSSVFDTEAIEYQGEQCSDEFYEQCFEKIFGTGHMVKDLMGTKEGKALVGKIIQKLYQGLGNSYYDLVMYAQHPIITDSDDNDWYSVNDEEWGDFMEQQMTRKTGGLMTIIDTLKDVTGLENMNVEIDDSEISLDGKEYIGDAMDLFDRVIDAQPYEMKRMSRSASGAKATLLCSPSVFRKFESELIDEFGKGLNETFFYKMNANFQKALNLSTPTIEEGVLKYKGYVVVSMDEWEDFDNITGTITHRVTAVTPGNFGVAHDVPDIKQFKGMGMRLTQHLDDPWLGKMFMSTNFDIGMGIPNEAMIVNASSTFRPAVAA